MSHEDSLAEVPAKARPCRTSELPRQAEPSPVPAMKFPAPPIGNVAGQPLSGSLPDAVPSQAFAKLASEFPASPVTPGSFCHARAPCRSGPASAMATISGHSVSSADDREPAKAAAAFRGPPVADTDPPRGDVKPLAGNLPASFLSRQLGVHFHSERHAPVIELGAGP